MNQMSVKPLEAAPGLIADIGATNARFALVYRDGVRDERVLKCADYPGLREAAQAYDFLLLRKPS